MPFWLIPFAAIPLLVGAVIAFARARARVDEGDGGKVEDQKAIEEGKALPETTEKKRMRLRAGLEAAGLSPDFVRFFEIQAKHESDFRPRALNKTTAEVAASKRLGERNGTVGGIDFDSPQWTFGSKGLFQFLGANIAIRKGKLRFSKERTEPDMAYDPGISIVTAIDYAQGLTGWKQFTGTWASLDQGWGWPGKMDDPEKLAKAAKHLDRFSVKLGYPTGWAHEKVPTMTKRSRVALLALARKAKTAYQGVQ